MRMADQLNHVEEIHKAITLDRLLDAVEDDENIGFCIGCGESTEGGVEPDAERYRCESCGRHLVYGAEQLMLLTVS